MSAKPLTEATYFKGLRDRAIYSAQRIAYVPCVVLGLLLAWPYWLFTGRTLPVPKWMEKLDGMSYDGWY